LVRDVSYEWLDDRMLNRKRSAVGPLRKAIDAAVFTLIWERKFRIFPRAFLIFGNKELHDQVVAPRHGRHIAGFLLLQK
jgi:hypothetical protein